MSIPEPVSPPREPAREPFRLPNPCARMGCRKRAVLTVMPDGQPGIFGECEDHCHVPASEELPAREYEDWETAGEARP